VNNYSRVQNRLCALDKVCFHTVICVRCQAAECVSYKSPLFLPFRIQLLWRCSHGRAPSVSTHVHTHMHTHTQLPLLALHSNAYIFSSNLQHCNQNIYLLSLYNFVISCKYSSATFILRRKLTFSAIIDTILTTFYRLFWIHKFYIYFRRFNHVLTAVLISPYPDLLPDVFFFADGNTSFDASLVININSTNIPTIMMINRIYEHKYLLSL
jgi:hypothetical protein